MRKSIREVAEEHSIKFTKFTVVGLLSSLLQIALMWVFVDKLNVNTGVSAALIVSFIHILKFFVYHSIKLIKYQFIKYTVVNAFSLVLNFGISWFLIDVAKIPTVIATAIAIGSLAILRYLLFHYTNLMVK
ncbi:MAG TPA: GtrA family protein [Candidatus Nanoarchaeia archaeon]|nr:GtrA family protein [Candidatus Nanoarchaeia archaeon]